MIAQHALPILALAVGMSAATIWTLVLLRTIKAYVQGAEQRLVWLTMAVGATLASLGTLSSAIGFAIQRDFLPEILPQDFWSFLASVGRGALLMSGLIVLTHYRPPKADRR